MSKQTIKELEILKKETALTAEKIIKKQGSLPYLKRKLRKQIVAIQKLTLQYLTDEKGYDIKDFLEIISSMRVFESFIGVYKFRLKRIDSTKIPLPKEFNELPQQIYI